MRSVVVVRFDDLDDGDGDVVRGPPGEGQVHEGVDVDLGHQQDVPLEDRPGVEERHHVVGLQHEVPGHLARDDLAEHASVHGTDRATGAGLRR